MMKATAWALQWTILLCLIGAAHGYTKFTTNCSYPASETNFVSSPNTRGTLDILWSCLFTIFACTWTIQHLNVPEQRNGRDSGIIGDAKWALKDVWKTTKWMLVTVLAPEILLGKALSELMAARSQMKKMQRFAEEDLVEWDLGHAFFANMGGFMAKQNSSSEASATTERTSGEIKRLSLPSDGVLVPEHSAPAILYQIEVKRPPQDGDSNSTYLASPDEALKEFKATSLTEENEHHPAQPLALLGETLYQMRKENRITRLPDITSAELLDKSKGSIFIKAIAVAQVLWNGTQIIVRASRGLAITQLELATSAFSVCAIIIYLLLLRKPQNVRTPLRPINYFAQESKTWILDHNDENAFQCFDVFILYKSHSFGRIPWTSIPNDMVGEFNFSFVFLFGSVVGAVIFGGIHTAGWHMSFHTSIHSTLWRIACVYTTASPAYALALSYFLAFQSTDDNLGGDTFLSWILRTWNFAAAILYVVARLILLVQYFQTLLYLPPSAYISTWASDIPHVA